MFQFKVIVMVVVVVAVVVTKVFISMPNRKLEPAHSMFRHNSIISMTNRQTSTTRSLTLVIRDEAIQQQRQQQSPMRHHYHRFILPTGLFIDDAGGDDKRMFANQTTMLPTQQQRVIEIPIIIQLSGEFGNHLSKIAAGIGVAAMIHDFNRHYDSDRSPYRFTTNLHIRHQDHTTKGDTALQILQHCFPNLVQIQDNNEDEVVVAVVNQTALLNHPTKQQQQQQKLLLTVPNANNNPYHNINSHHATEVDIAFSRIIQDAIKADEAINTDDSKRTTLAPFIVYSNHLVGYFDVYMDRFYDLYRQYFIINETDPTCGCVVNTKNDDENMHHPIVFYYRGYHIEMPKKATRLGFDEISPAALVSYLQNTTHNTTGRNGRPTVTIVSRFPDYTSPYVMALTEAGYSVQVLQHMNSSSHGGMTSILHDFCVLRRADQFLLGPIRSTYFMWASLLATATPSLHVTAYTTASQLDWAQQQVAGSSQLSTAALDSISPSNYFSTKNDTNENHSNELYQSFWKERNFHFITV